MKLILLLIAVVSLWGCKHPLEIRGAGDIEEALAGARACSLQAYLRGSRVCAENEVLGGDYMVAYRPVPHPGCRHFEFAEGEHRGGVTLDPLPVGKFPAGCRLADKGFIKKSVAHVYRTCLVGRAIDGARLGSYAAFNRCLDFNTAGSQRHRGKYDK